MHQLLQYILVNEVKLSSLNYLHTNIAIMRANLQAISVISLPEG